MPKQTPPRADENPADESPAGSNSTETPTPPRPTGNRFFSWMRGLGIPRQPGWIGGVCAGIAARLGIDVVIVRGIVVVIAVLGGPAILLYAAAWLLLPDHRDRIHLEDLMRGIVEGPIAAIAGLVVLSMLPVAQGFWSLGAAYWGEPFWGASLGRVIWTVVLIGLLVWFVVWIARRAQRGSTPTTMPATTDDRPHTIPQPTTPTPQQNGEAALTPPPAPAADASAEQLAAWREQQALWKSQHDAFRQQRASERQAANQAAAAQARTERMARLAVEREARARTRSHPLYSVSLIGVALIAGALAALLLGDGQPNPADILSGVAVAVGVLGAGIIVNGAIGHRAGGASAVAILLIIPLVLSGVFPQGANIRYSGDVTFTPHHQSDLSSETYVDGFGDVTIDLTDFYSTPRPTTGNGFSSEQITLLVGRGDVKVIVPADEYVSVGTATGSGSIRTNDGTRLLGDHAHSDEEQLSVDGDVDWQNPKRVLGVRVAVGNGNITVEQAPSEETN